MNNTEFKEISTRLSKIELAILNLQNSNRPIIISSGMDVQMIDHSKKLGSRQPIAKGKSNG